MTREEDWDGEESGNDSLFIYLLIHSLVKMGLVDECICFLLFFYKGKRERKVMKLKDGGVVVIP